MNWHAVFDSHPRFIVIFLLTASLPMRAGDSIPQQPKAAQPTATTLTVMNRPLIFERSESEGSSEAPFISRGQSYSLFLAPSEVVLVLSKGSTNRQSFSERERSPQDLAAAERNRGESSVVRIKMVRANPRPHLTGRDELRSTSHYFIGNDPRRWRTDVPNYSKVEYENVYPGVNLVFYGNQRQLEFDFVVSSGADPNSIQLALEGARSLRLDVDGNLALRTDGGEVLLHKPLVYQETNGHRQSIEGSFVFKGEHEAGFQVGSYDHTLPLVIDPVIDYSTFLGGSFQDLGSAIAVDSQGNAYVTGYTLSTNFPTVNPLQSNKAYQSAFVTKFNPAGQLVYSTYLSGQDSKPSATAGLGIAVDAVGNAYVTGSTSSTNFPTVNPFQSTNATVGDYVCIEPSNAFVTKLNSTGSALLYSTYLGGSGIDEGLAITVDAGGSAYVTGYTYSTNSPTNAPRLPKSYGFLGDFASD